MDPSRLKSFQAARQRLVEQRHALIKSLGSTFQAEQSEAHINLLIRVQKAIEVVDKAIDEEQSEPNHG
jgi:hypothetical protein